MGLVWVGDRGTCPPHVFGGGGQKALCPPPMFSWIPWNLSFRNLLFHEKFIALIIFGKMHFLLIPENEYFHEIKCSRITSFMGLMCFFCFLLAVPKSCPNNIFKQTLEHGRSRCIKEGNSSYSCVRSCDFPYVPSQPEFTKEYCSNETGYFWTHVLRNNQTEFPPCVGMLLILKNFILLLWEDEFLLPSTISPILPFLHE